MRRIRELSDAREAAPGRAGWLNTLEYQSTVKRQMTFKELPNMKHEKEFVELRIMWLSLQHPLHSIYETLMDYGIS